MAYTIRTLYVLLASVVLCWFAQAQHSGSSLSAAEQVRQLQANQELLQQLLADSLRLSQTQTTLNRAIECHQAAKTLAAALEKSTSATTPEAERISELGDHYTKLLKEGLAPTLAEARQQMSPSSRDFPRLKELHEQTRQSLKDLQNALPKSGDLAESRALVQLREKLAALSDQFPQP